MGKFVIQLMGIGTKELKLVKPKAKHIDYMQKKVMSKDAKDKKEKFQDCLAK